MSLLSTPTAAQSPSAISSGTLAQSSSTSKVHSPSPSRSAIVSSRSCSTIIGRAYWTGESPRPRPDRGLVTKSVMRSGGDLLVASVHNTYSVDVDQAARDVGEQFGRIEPAEGFLRDQRLPDHGHRVL